MKRIIPFLIILVFLSSCSWYSVIPPTWDECSFEAPRHKRQQCKLRYALYIVKRARDNHVICAHGYQPISHQKYGINWHLMAADGYDEVSQVLKDILKRKDVNDERLKRAIFWMSAIRSTHSKYDPRCFQYERVINVLKKYKCVGLKGSVSTAGTLEKSRLHETNYADGNKDIGNAVNGKQHGQATYTWPSGAKYEGEWKDGKKHGQGAYIWPDGDKYVGEWKHNRPTGGWLHKTSGRKVWVHQNTEGKWIVRER